VSLCDNELYDTEEVFGVDLEQVQRDHGNQTGPRAAIAPAAATSTLVGRPRKPRASDPGEDDVTAMGDARTDPNRADGAISGLRRHIAYKRDGERTLRAEFAAHMLTALERGADPDYEGLLRDACWPEIPPFLFHSAPTEARDAIRTGGLRACQPGSALSDQPWADPDGICASQAAGVYASDQPDTGGKWSRWAAWDVWRIDATGLTWSIDPLNPRCWSVTGDIDATRMCLVGTYRAATRP
jgi:hypothetical protein